MLIMLLRLTSADQHADVGKVRMIRRTSPSVIKAVNRRGDTAGYVQCSYQHPAFFLIIAS